MPVSALFSVWLYRSIELYFKHDETKTLGLNKGSRLYHIGVIEYQNIKDDIYSVMGFTGNADYKLFIKPQLLTELEDQSLLKSSTKKKAILFDKSSHYTGKVKYRGDNSYHWMYPQKSWRFDTSKNKLYNGVKKINFIIPKGHELLNNHLGYKLAKQLSLIAPDSKLVTMSVNNKFDGPKLMVEQIDESFLRKNGRMPNDIYKGDNMGSQRVIGATADIFKVPSVWNKAAYNNHYDKENRYPLEKLLGDVNDNIIDLFDIDQIARFSAFIDMTNSLHYDKVHNWIFYYDAYYERMYPLVWDPLAWWYTWDRKKEANIVTAKLLDVLHRDYKFLYQKYEVINNFYTNERDGFDSIVNSEVENAERIIKEVGYTMRIGQRHIINKNDSLKELGDFKKRVNKRFDMVEGYFLGDVDSGDYKYSDIASGIRLSVSGSKLISKVIIKTKVLNGKSDINIEYYANGKILNKGIESDLEVINGDIVINQKLLANAVIAGNMQFEEATYDFIITNFNPADIIGVDLVFSNLKNERLSVKKVDHVKQKEFNGLFNIIEDSPKINKIKWSGTKTFKGFEELHSDVLIEKGTRLIFEKDAVVKLYGKVTALGTQEEPIIFKGIDKNNPWGSFVLKDEAANGSIFEYCQFSDGSGAKGKLYEYTAMLSIHNVKNVMFKNCLFKNSQVTDDMVHVVYSDVVFKDTQFINSLSDALDADISNIVVDSCEFINSGNDSIDLMTSNSVVINTKFKNSKDKGISIGEGSSLLAINNYLDSNEIGMQSKDTSKAYIYNTTFVNNKIAIDAYHKNWRYNEGGSIFIDNSRFNGNNVVATVGKKSNVVINNSEIDDVTNLSKRNIGKHKIVISKDGLIESDLVGLIFEQHYSRIRPQTIGNYE